MAIGVVRERASCVAREEEPGARVQPSIFSRRSARAKVSATMDGNHERVADAVPDGHREQLLGVGSFHREGVPERRDAEQEHEQRWEAEGRAE